MRWGFVRIVNARHSGTRAILNLLVETLHIATLALNKVGREIYFDEVLAESPNEVARLAVRRNEGRDYGHPMGFQPRAGKSHPTDMIVSGIS